MLFSSSTLKTNTRSVSAAELLVLVNLFDLFSTKRWALCDIFEKHFLLELFSDSKSVYGDIIGINLRSKDVFVLTCANIFSYTNAVKFLECHKYQVLKNQETD